MRILISILPILIYLTILVVIDFHKYLKVRILIYSFFYGMLISPLSYYIDGTIYKLFEESLINSNGYFSLTTMPFMEEMLKMIPIVLLIQRKKLNSKISGLLIGIAIGIGFSIVGNIFMLKSMQTAGTWILIFRGINTAFNQGLLTGLFAILVIFYNSKFQYKLIISSAISLVIVSLLHATTNYFFSNIAINLAINLIFLPIVLIIFIFKDIMHTQKVKSE